MFNKLSSLKKYMIYGSVPICLIATLNHFLYEFSGNNAIVGIFTPINECVWEHLKLADYIVNNKSYNNTYVLYILST